MYGVCSWKCCLEKACPLQVALTILVSLCRTGKLPDGLATHPTLITIDLRNNKIEELPAAWYNISDSNLAVLRELPLQDLRLANNSLSGVIPSGLAVMAKLLDLNLAVNAFTGGLPFNISGVEGRHSFFNMLTFNLSRNSLQGLIPQDYGTDMRMFWQQDTNLVEGLTGVFKPWNFTFDLSGNQLEGDLPAFLRKPMLQERQLSWLHVNLTNAGDFANACDEDFGWIPASPCVPDAPEVVPSFTGMDERSVDDDGEADYEGEELDDLLAAKGMNEDNEHSHEDESLAAGAIAGIVVGCIVGIALLAVLALVVIKKVRSSGGSGAAPGSSGLPVWPFAPRNTFEKFDTEGGAAPKVEISVSTVEVDTVVPAA